MHAQGDSEPVWTGNDHVFGLLRKHAGERVLLLANFSAGRAARRGRRAEHGLALDAEAAVPDGRPLRMEDGELVLAPYQFAWITG